MTPNISLRLAVILAVPALVFHLAAPVTSQDQSNSAQDDSSQNQDDQQQDQDDDQADEDEIDIETELAEEYGKFCIRAMEKFAQETPRRAQRLLDNHTTRMKRRFREGGTIYVRVSAMSTGQDENSNILEIRQPLGVNDRIRANYFGGVQLNVSLAEGITEVKPGSVVRLQGIPHMVACNSVDDLIYKYEEMGLDGINEVMRAQCEGGAFVFLLMEDVTIERVLTEEEVEALDQEDRVIR